MHQASLTTTTVPQHIAVIMDGNRRWARQRGLPKAIGHASGAKRVRSLVEACSARGVRWLTLFAFSTENWKRPAEEVTSLMGLFLLYLQKEASDMHKKGVRLKIIGDRSAFDARLQALMANVEAMTADNSTITLTIAANYGGRWDMLQAVQAWQAAQPQPPVNVLTEDALQPYLSLADAPDPELLIRTGGESRISNFMLWQSAYTELYFTDALWPDFNSGSLDQALAWYAQRDRRFGGANATSPISELAAG
ncbi:polyprenyl diphosphate synthase [Polaromonas sp.]|uniref:polyprenyl diphosphate synthase n=1 Tax=Polaromonas sp. TaxID=1869339 RepID=UPI0017A148BC|nr:polyprenyl diphosphate synthase [Polaromonas sp.]NMM06006.1 di-trans,poly-cis-decaprenylcistransferase [Polaromonas sp.]